MGSIPTTIVDSREMQTWCLEQKAAGKRIGFVPTMGALHEGHLSLVDLAREQSDQVVVSIFVNPTQFGENEDFSKYPRTLKDDIRQLSERGVDCVFTPTTASVYPEGFQTFLSNIKLASMLEGASRPGHFDGVLTVVMKLFQIVQPHVAVFGQKDYQQLAVIQTMVRDYLMPIDVVPAPISRTADGLARSSRNRYLDDDNRAIAPLISKGLRRAAELHQGGERQVDVLRQAVVECIEERAEFSIEYVEIRRQVDLESFDGILDQPAVVLVAARLAGVRLIDNWELD